MFLAIGNDILILLRFHVVVSLKFFLFSLLVIVNVSVDVKSTEEHLKTETILNKFPMARFELSLTKQDTHILDDLLILIAYQEGHHVSTESVLHPQWELAVDSKSIETQN